MKKLFAKALAVLITSTIVFSNTGFMTFAANFGGENANVVITSTINTDETLDTTSTTDTTSKLTDGTESTTETSTTEDASTLDFSTTDSSIEESNDSSLVDSDTEESSDNLSSSDTQSVETTNTDTTNEDLQVITSIEQATSSTVDERDATNEAANYIWEGITFGQSTDLNFESSILEEKIGTQYAKETQINVIDSSDDTSTPITKDAIIIESRGGKIANAHDGITFYYTTLPTSKNFVLEAKVFINQFGPENGSTPSKQEAVGIMARDILGSARQNPMIAGYEELPAASNIAATMVIAKDKSHTSALNISSYQRNGVFYPYGNAHISYSAKQFAQINTDASRTATQDVTPSEGENYESDDFFTLRLERKDDTFVTTYIDSNGVEKTGSIDDPERLAVIDEESMYIGFFSSRNAKATFTDIYLSTSEANTEPCSFTPDSYAIAFTNLSNTETSSIDYTVAFRANFDGTAEIIQDGTVIESAGTVTAGEIYELATTLNNETTDFVINYVSAQGNKTANFTVTKNEAYQKDLYVAVDGTSSGSGSIDSPLDLTTAINYLSEGYTLYLREGTYDALDLESTVSGSSKGMKTMSAYNGENVIFSGNSYVKASYWKIKGISITGSDSAGLRASGNNNIFEYCTFYENEDTGFQLGMGSDTDPLTWPENNIIRYCTSYNNIDASGINADGFAAKLGVGKNNLFDSCISYGNADDGWDLFNKLGDAKNEPITIQNCIAYSNGNNGFKLGGEGYAVDHVISNCLAFKNNLDGFTDNFNTGSLTVTNCTSVDNKRYNYIFRLNPYATADVQNIFTNNISFRSNYDSDSVADYISGRNVNSYFFGSENDTITANDFISVTSPSSYERNADGTINFGDYMRPTSSSFLATSGVGTAYVGAIAPVSSDPGTTPDTLVTSISLDQTSSTIKVGESLTLKATISPADATNQTLKWESSNSSVASVDNNGTILAVAEGNATITVTSCDGSNITATCNITVQPNVISVSSISIIPSSTIKVGESLTLKASVSPADATNQTLKWESSNASVVSVDTNGTILALDEGNATITVTSCDGSYITATCNITVQPNVIYVSSVAINKTKLVLAKGSTETLSTTITPQNATNTSISWSSSNTKVATVDGTGKISAKAYGTAVITATSSENSSIFASCTVSVGYKITYKLNKGTNHDKNPSAYYEQKVSLYSPTRKGYVFKGWYTDSKFKTKITSISKNSTKNYTLYAKWEKVEKPAAPTLKTLSNIKSNKMKVALKSSVSGAKGYEITYATNKKFTKNKETVTISKASTLTKTISKLTKNKTYYVKVRAYKLDSAGNKIYGKYSNVLNVKIKK